MAPLGLSPLLLATLVLSLASLASCGGVNITTLDRSIVVTTRINGLEIASDSQLHYLQDNLTVAWHLNETFQGQDSTYKQVVIRLCYAAVSAQGRPWRAANTDLSKSKTCFSTIATQPYTTNSSSALSYDYMGHRPQYNASSFNVTGNITGNVTVWKAPNTTPGGYFFVRVFVLNSTSSGATPANNAVAMGQSTDANMTANTFEVVPYTGVTTSLIITIVVMSVGTYALLFGVFFAERMIKKNK
jgi:hypothetical protein